MELHLHPFLPAFLGRAGDLTSTNMPVLSEDSGECLPGLGLHDPEDKSLPSTPRLERKQAAASLCSRELPCLQALGMGAGGENVHRAGLKCCLRVHWGVPQGRRHPLHLLLFVFLTLPSGLHETLALLTSQLRPDSNHKDEMGFLKDVFSEKSLSYLMKVKPHVVSPW